MPEVGVTAEIIQKQIADLKIAADEIGRTRQAIMSQYQQLGSQWNDIKYRMLGGIVNESNASLRNIEKIFLQSQKALLQMLDAVEEYEATSITSHDLLAVTNPYDTGTLPLASLTEQPLILRRNKEEAISSGLKAIDQVIDAKRDDYHDKGIFDESIINHELQLLRDECEIQLYNDVYGNVTEQCVSCLCQLGDYFCEANWGIMSATERADALNTLAVRAGNAFRIDIQGVNFFNGSDNSRGYYSGDGYLYLNSDVLNNPANRLDAVDTIFHEGRHAFQHATTDNPTAYSIDRNTAQRWAENFYPNYVRYEQNPARYFSQPIEADARAFAENVLRHGGLL